MTKTLSLYLDFLRLLAATAVLIGHAQGYILPIIPNILAGHADEGVAIFFVLSGFVIRYVLDEKENHWRSYLLARASRIFSVVVVALLVTFAVDRAGLSINRIAYDNTPFFNSDYAPALLRAITFTNELWSQESVFGSNHAYWSLGYEVQYYLVFGLLFFLPGKLSVPITLLWVVAVGPAIALYFSLWLMGVYLFKITKLPLQLSPMNAAVLFVLSIFLYCIIKMSAIHDLKSWMTHGVANLSDARIVLFSLIYYLGVGICVCLNIISFKYIFKETQWLSARSESTIRWLAGGSFTLYLVHQPLLVFARAVAPGIAKVPSAGFAVLFAIIIFSFGLAEIGERRKSIYKQFFLGAFRWSRRATSTAFANRQSGT